jgi:hypothetical protein
MSQDRSTTPPSEETLLEHATLLASGTLLAKSEIEWRAKVLAQAFLARSEQSATRESIIEECVKVCLRVKANAHWTDGVEDGAEQCAAALRSLIHQRVYTDEAITATEPLDALSPASETRVTMPCGLCGADIAMNAAPQMAESASLGGPSSQGSKSSAAAAQSSPASATCPIMGACRAPGGQFSWYSNGDWHCGCGASNKEPECRYFGAGTDSAGDK